MTSPSQPIPRSLCSEMSLASGLPLIGTAGCYDSILAFELETPWSARLTGSRACDIALDGALARIRDEAPAVRLIALEPPLRRDRARVLWMTRSAANSGGFTRREFDVAAADLAATLASLAFADAAPAGEIQPGAARDLLVCTHGARDACCGKFGYPIYRELVRLAGGEGRIRIWRCSHLGGHRFAPTLLDLPSGRIFGRVEEGDAAAILAGGRALLERLEAIYRGCCALPEAAQIVERQMWLRTGEGFETAALQWKLDGGGDAWRVTLTAEAAGRRPEAIDATVMRAQADAVLTPASCGRDAEREAPWRIVA